LFKIQSLSVSAVKINGLTALLISSSLFFTSAIGFAEPLKPLDKYGFNRTRSSIFRAKPGEDTAKILERLGFNKNAQKVVSTSRDRSQLMILSTNKPLEFKGFSNNYGLTGRSHFARRFNRYTHKFNMMQLASAQGAITSTMNEAAKKARLSDELVDQLTQIFSWDIDFVTNLRPGDRFTVVYERGGYNGQDDIVAAEVTNRGRLYKAVRYIDKDGYANYYTPEGKALQKAFLTTPVDFARISSHFDMHRMHPVLHRIRAHKGVDYAARTGTPVKATGTGVVTFLGRKGGYGQVVILQHGDRYETLYAHLSGFKSALREGSNVRQGEIIGYVGQSGLATGPHLHYEFRVNGIHQNPLTAQLSNSMPLNSTEVAEFKSQIQDPLAKLNMIKANSLFARNNQMVN